MFQDLLYQNVRAGRRGRPPQNTQAPTGLELGTGVQLVSTEKLYTQGNVNQTGNSLDLAINGRGFFQVLMPDGTLAYTRDGSFQISATGQVVTASGYPCSRRSRFRRAPRAITIGTDGTVQRAACRPERADRRSARCSSPNSSTRRACSRTARTCWSQSASSGTAQTGQPGLSGLGTLQQGATESSNVNVVEEMVNMIETQRAYEMNTKAIETTDQMLQYLSSNL